MSGGGGAAAWEHKDGGQTQPSRRAEGAEHGDVWKRERLAGRAGDGEPGLGHGGTATATALLHPCSATHAARSSAAAVPAASRCDHANLGPLALRGGPVHHA